MMPVRPLMPHETPNKIDLALQAQCVEEACRRWWEIKRPDGSRIATCSWDEFAATGHTSVADYRLRMAAALGYNQ